MVLPSHFIRFNMPLGPCIFLHFVLENRHQNWLDTKRWALADSQTDGIDAMHDIIVSLWDNTVDASF